MFFQKTASQLSREETKRLQAEKRRLEKEEERLKLLKEFENKLHNEYGIEYICGIDEAGRGPLAGPVAVAAVIMPKDSFIEGVNDSKKVSEKNKFNEQ